MDHCTAPYETELIYAWIKLGSPELALEMKKKKEEWQSAVFQTAGSDVYNCFGERSWSCFKDILLQIISKLEIWQV